MINIVNRVSSNISKPVPTPRITRPHTRQIRITTHKPCIPAVILPVHGIIQPGTVRIIHISREYTRRADWSAIGIRRLLRPQPVRQEHLLVPGAAWLITSPIPAGGSVNVTLLFANPNVVPLQYDVVA